MNDALLPDPSPRLTAAFERVLAERMRGLPIVNAALAVEAVDFAPWRGSWLGVMVTPWSINAMLVVHDPRAWRPLAPGAKRTYRFPAGDYEFVGAHDDAIGEYQSCSLFSPALEFADHATARLVARCARIALLEPSADVGEDGRPATPIADLHAAIGAPMTKREFLRARFIGGRRGD